MHHDIIFNCVLWHCIIILIYCAVVLSTVFCYFRFINFISCCCWLFYHHDSILYNSNSSSDHFLWFLLFNLIDGVTIPPWKGLTRSVLSVSLRNLLSTKLAISIFIRHKYQLFLDNFVDLLAALGIQSLMDHIHSLGFSIFLTLFILSFN